MMAQFYVIKTTAPKIQAIFCNYVKTVTKTEILGISKPHCCTKQMFLIDLVELCLFISLCCLLLVFIFFPCRHLLFFLIAYLVFYAHSEVKIVHSFSNIIYLVSFFPLTLFFFIHFHM